MSSAYTSAIYAVGTPQTQKAGAWTPAAASIPSTIPSVFEPSSENLSCIV